MQRVTTQAVHPVQRVREWADRHLLLLVGAGLLLAGLAVAIGGSLYDQNTVREAVEQFYANGGSELISIALTVLVIDTLGRRRATQQEKAALILQMGSPDNAFAREAVRTLRVRGWLGDGSLRLANLESANLQEAKLQGASLFEADLRAADLSRANLQAATLMMVNLQEAKLDGANLQWAGLFRTSLQGAHLDGANLEGTLVSDVEFFDEDTALPDGTKWSPDTDLARFTEPDHPDFWRSDDPDSPAYGGDDDD